MDKAGLILKSIKRGGRSSMSTHDRNLILVMCFAAALVSFNFFAVVSGAADGYYSKLTEILSPILKSGH
jgi:hypothetical protein